MSHILLSVLILLGLVSCGNRTPETAESLAKDKENLQLEQTRQAKARVTFLYDQIHACDKNDGIKDIDGYRCYKGGCSALKVDCVDGMSKILDQP